jgi:hypothetical protein
MRESEGSWGVFEVAPKEVHVAACEEVRYGQHEFDHLCDCGCTVTVGPDYFLVVHQEHEGAESDA